MEIKIMKEAFQKALALTQNVVEKKTTMPILANVLMEAENKQLKISATDLEVGLCIETAVEVFNPGKVTIFAKGLFDIIKELPSELVHLKLLENNWLSIKCGKAEFKIVGMKADEFPAIPTSKNENVYVEEREMLLDMIGKISNSMSTDETRYNLNGIFVQSRGSNLSFVSTDGHRLSVVERKSKSNWKVGKGVIIPRKGVLELKKLLDSYEGDFSIRVDEKNICVEKDNVVLVVRLIEGQFPPYEQVIPKDNMKIASVDKALFTSSLRRVVLMASDKTKGVSFSFSPGHLEISTSNPDFGEAREDLDISYKGETFKVGFNAKYFIDVLGSLDDEQVVLELKDDVSPCLIRSEYDKGLINVIMPMRM